MYDFNNLWNDANRFDALDVPNGPELFGASLRNASGEKLAIRGLASAIGSEVNRGTPMRAPLPSMVRDTLEYLVSSSDNPDMAKEQASKYVVDPFPGLTPTLSSWISERLAS